MAAIDVTTERADPNLVLKRMFSILDDEGVGNFTNAQARARLAGHLELAARMVKYGHAMPHISKESPDGLRRVGRNVYAADKPSVGQATLVFGATLPVDASTITIDDGTATPVEFEYDPGGDGILGAGTEIDTENDTTAQQVITKTVNAINGVALSGLLDVWAIDMGDGATIALIAGSAGEIADLSVAVSTDPASNITATDFQFDADAA